MDTDELLPLLSATAQGDKRAFAKLYETTRAVSYLPLV